MQNDGHSIALDFAGKGYGGITFNKAWYNLISMNVHVYSEHTFRGKHFPMELHLVHKKTDANTVVIIAIPVTTADPKLKDGCPNLDDCKVAGVDQTPETDISKALSGEGEITLPKNGETKSIKSFLIKPLVDGTFFEYAGSLTVPNCAEKATWLVKREPFVLPMKVISALQDTIITANGGYGNYRDVVEMADRDVYLRKANFSDPPVPMPSNEVQMPQRDENTPLKGEEDAIAAKELALKVKIKAADIYKRLVKSSRAATKELPDDMREAIQQAASGEDLGGGNKFQKFQPGQNRSLYTAAETIPQDVMNGYIEPQ